MIKSVPTHRPNAPFIHTGSVQDSFYWAQQGVKQEWNIYNCTAAVHNCPFPHDKPELWSARHCMNHNRIRAAHFCVLWMTNTSMLQTLTEQNSNQTPLLLLAGTRELNTAVWEMRAASPWWMSGHSALLVHCDHQEYLLLWQKVLKWQQSCPMFMLIFALRLIFLVVTSLDLNQNCFT